VSKIECIHEDAVNQALESDTWPPELLDHVADCPVCGDLMLVARFFQQRGVIPEPEGPLPDPSFIWWRAQMKARAAAADRATRAIGLLQHLTVVAGALLVALGFVRMWPQWKTWFTTLLPDSLPSTLPSNMAQPGLVMLASVAVLLFLLLFDRYEARTER
jgi:hypothetical protein